MSKIKVTKLPQGILIIKQEGGRDFFISSDNNIVISIQSLAFLLKFLVANDYVHYRVLSGIMSELEEFKENL